MSTEEPNRIILKAKVISATSDGAVFGPEDAQLDLSLGTPRFYIMRLPRRGLAFDRITYHAKVTQCLGSLGVEPWFLVVAEPSGSVSAAPGPQDLHAFRVPAGSFLRLKKGTWHAGPLFDSAHHLDFYNLELADTNITDHNTHHYGEDGLHFQVSAD